MSNFYCHPGRAGGSPIGLALRILAALLSFAVLIQFFIAGMAAMTNPEWWTYHSTWVGIFQWIAVPLPILAFIGEHPRYIGALRSRSLIQIALQYVLAHRARCDIPGDWLY